MQTIEYFYSAHSAFAYLGSRMLMDIATTAGRAISHRPIDLNAVVEACGSTPFSQRTPGYRAYFFEREIQRWSEERDAPVCGYPRYHHHDTTLANSMLVAGVLDSMSVDALAHAFLQAHWRDDADLADLKTLTRLAEQSGYDGGRLSDMAKTDAVRAAYQANTAEAIRRSVFGSPTYFVDGDMFYGQDRLELVRRALSRPYR